jgi:hypothetical protein
VKFCVSFIHKLLWTEQREDVFKIWYKRDENLKLFSQFGIEFTLQKDKDSNFCTKMAHFTVGALVLFGLIVAFVSAKQNLIDIYRKEVFDYAVLLNQKPVVVFYTKG